MTADSFILLASCYFCYGTAVPNFGIVGLNQVCLQAKTLLTAKSTVYMIIAFCLETASIEH